MNGRMETTTATKSQRILWATKVGAPEWQEQLITEQGDKIEAASAWAKANGFDRLRVSTFDGRAPNFARTINR